MKIILILLLLTLLTSCTIETYTDDPDYPEMYGPDNKFNPACYSCNFA